MLDKLRPLWYYDDVRKRKKETLQERKKKKKMKYTVIYEDWQQEWEDETYDDLEEAICRAEYGNIHEVMDDEEEIFYVVDEDGNRYYA